MLVPEAVGAPPPPPPGATRRASWSSCSRPSCVFYCSSCGWWQIATPGENNDDHHDNVTITYCFQGDTPVYATAVITDPTGAAKLVSAIA